jgi:hypothetical protein
VFSGPDGENETVIRLVGYVDPVPMGIIAMQPRKTDVGLLAAGRDNEIQVEIANTGDAPLVVSRIASTKFKVEYFNAAESGEIVIAAGRKIPVKLTVKPAEPGRFLDTILIYSDARNDIGKGYKGLLSGEAR